MPLYSYRCCNDHNFDRFLKLAEYDSLQYCECGQKAKRQIKPTMIAPAFEGYESPIDGKHIGSKKKMREDMVRNGCVPYEPSLRQEADKKVKDDEAKLDKSVDKYVDKMWATMDSKKRESLARELTSGADINYKRL